MQTKDLAPPDAVEVFPVLGIECDFFSLSDIRDSFEPGLKGGVEVPGRAFAHSPSLALLKFSVKVVRHKDEDFCCGGLWKKPGFRERTPRVNHFEVLQC